MTCLGQCAALLPMAICTQPAVLPDSAYRQPQAQVMTASRDGLPSAVLQGSADLVARTNLVGTWKATYLEYDGQPRPDVAAGLEMNFTRGHLELRQQGRPPIVVAYSLNPTKSPLGFSWKLPQPHSVMLQDGIYYLQGDTLVICLASINAPTISQFLTQPGERETLFVLKRT